MKRHLSFANVVSVVALFIALGGGAYAVQVAKKNSVNSKSIRNNSIRSVDVGKGQIRSSDIRDGQVGAADIGDGQVGSAEVADGSLSATDIDVASLGDATSGATIQPVSDCTQTLTSYQRCVSTEVTLERAGHIYASADGTADSGSFSNPVGVNTCRLTVDGTPLAGEYVIAANFSPGEAFSFSRVSEALGAGLHMVRLECKGNGTLPGPRIFTPALTTLELGTG